MRTRPSPTLAICIIAAAITIGLLFRPADGPPSPVSEYSPNAPTVAAGPSIEIAGFAFSDLASVSPGTEIRVRNADSAPHTVTATDGSFDTGVLDTGTEAVFTAPATPGSFDFFCAVHPSMTGQLVVG